MNNFPSVLESIKDLNNTQINALLSLSEKLMKKNDDAPVFTDRRPIIATSFLENSTRTKHSFAIAIHKLGATYLDFNAETSSLKKGETLEETLLTLNCQGVDLCIIRTSISQAFQEFKNRAPLKIINGGDGTNEHPTQALLDLFTLKNLGLELEGKTLAIMGDLRHSRVGRSLIHLLPSFGLKVLLCGPEVFLPEQKSLPEGVSCTTDRAEVMAKADYLYLLRIQKERHAPSDKIDEVFKTYSQNYGVSLDLLKKSKPRPVMHPGPANISVEITEDLMHSPYYLGYEQVKHSTFMRMAIIQAMIMNGDKTIGQYHEAKRLFN